MDDFLIFILVVGITLYISVKSYTKISKKKLERIAVIDNFTFPNQIETKVKQTYPHLDLYQVKDVIKGLKEYFHLSLEANGEMISMPSKAIDVGWHEFILFTQKYSDFCEVAFGRFLHHTPAEGMKSQKVAKEGIKRTWRLACHRENIFADKPKMLPWVFAIDEKYNINDGFHYTLDCSKEGYKYCGSHIGCGSGCSGSSGSGSDAGSDGGCGGGCG
jgi:hypothetical protein